MIITRKCKICRDFTEQEVFHPIDANNYIMYKCLKCNNFEKVDTL